MCLGLFCSQVQCSKKVRSSLFIAQEICDKLFIFDLVFNLKNSLQFQENSNVTTKSQYLLQLVELRYNNVLFTVKDFFTLRIASERYHQCGTAGKPVYLLWIWQSISRILTWVCEQRDYVFCQQQGSNICMYEIAWPTDRLGDFWSPKSTGRMIYPESISMSQAFGIAQCVVGSFY